MDKPSWLLLSESDRIDQLSKWLARIIAIDNEVPTRELTTEKKELERAIIEVLDFVKDYE